MANQTSQTNKLQNIKEPKLEVEFVTETDAARFLSVPVGTLRWWRCVKRGPRFHKAKQSKLVRYSIADLRAFMDGEAQ